MMKRNSELIWCYVFLVGVLNVVGAEWNTNDYMKREHSLVRPYQGSKNLINSSFAFWFTLEK